LHQVSDSLPGAAISAPPPRSQFFASLGEVVVCSGYPSQLLIGGLLQVGGIEAADKSGKLSATFIFALSLGDTILLLSLITWLLTRRGERLVDVVFGRKPIAPEIAAGILSVPLVITLVIAATLVVRSLAPSLHNVPDNPLEALIGTRTGLVSFMIVAIVAGGIREEVQRAFLLHRFRTDLGGLGVGLTVTSVAFGLGHTLQGWDAAVITGLLGATWGVLYAMRGSAVAGMVSHSIFNNLEVVRALF
jgi:membrane protease YdiL (CAAX protease family)